MLVPTSLTRGLWLYSGLVALTAYQVAGQDQAALSQSFEGKQVTVKMDMPGSQTGVDIYPNKPQPLDTKSYAARLKSFGVSLRNGDTVMITKVKVKKDLIEFQLGGGGYGTVTDITDEAVHFQPAEKSMREKELENQVNKETDDNRRRSLLRELDDLKRDRERQDRRRRAAAEQDADLRRIKIAQGRERGGSRFNIRVKTQVIGDSITPQFVMNALAQYITFTPDVSGPNESRTTERLGSATEQMPLNSNPVQSLRKGLTRAQVETLFGPPIESHDQVANGLAITNCTYQTAAQTVQADFVNGVLVQYTVSSR